MQSKNGKKPKPWHLQRTVGEEVKIGCRMINGTTHEKATKISVSPTPTDRHDEVCEYSDELHCWHNSTLVQTVEVVCLWAHDNIGLSFKFKMIAMDKPVTTQHSNSNYTSST